MSSAARKFTQKNLFLAAAILATSQLALIETPAAQTVDQTADSTLNFAASIKQDVRSMVKGAMDGFPIQKATIADLVTRYPNNWYQMIQYQPVLQIENGGGTVIANCRENLNAALGQATGSSAAVAVAANKCVNDTEVLLANSGSPVPAQMAVVRQKVAGFLAATRSPA